MIHSSWPSSTAGTCGFSTMCTLASAAESVIVMMKSVSAKPEQAEHEELAAPERQEPLEHRDRALPVRALGRHPAVDRQRAEQREQHQDERRERAEQPGGEERDARLVPEGGEVVDPGQAHDLPPGVRLVSGVLRGMRSGMTRSLVRTLEEPSRNRSRLRADSRSVLTPPSNRRR